MIRATLTLLLFTSQLLLAFDASFTADSLQGSLGDILSFGWNISHAQDVTLEVGEFDLEPTGIELIDQELEPTDTGSALRFQVAVYDSIGSYHFPSFTLYAREAGHLDSLFLRGPDLQITSILGAADTTFRDIKGLHHIRTPLPLKLILGILGIVLLIGVALFIFLRRKHAGRMGQAAQKVIIPPEQAHVIALRELERLRRSKYLRFEQFKNFYTELSFIVKQYLEQRYLINALELTTCELMELLRSGEELNNEQQMTIRKLLEIADFVKFAKGSSSEVEAGSYLSGAIAIVKQTKINLNQGDKA